MTVVRSPRFATRARRTSLTIAAAGMALALAACGSQLDPNEVAVAGGGTVGSGGVVVGADGEVISADGGTTGSVDGSTGGDTGSSGSDSSGGSGSSGSGSGSSGGSDSGSSGGDGGTDEPIPTGSCDGFKNSTGISNDTITIGNASDISGPVPGLFESAQDAVKAFVAYYNRSNPDGICGRSLALKNYDSRTDASADQRNYVDMCDNVFAAVGSMSAFDSGGASTAQKCGLPDLRSTTVNPERVTCSTCFSAQSVNPGQIPRAMPTYFLDQFSAQTKKVALLSINAGAAPVNAASFRKGWESVGWKIDYFQAIDVAEFNFAPYVQQMKDRGIDLVYYLGPYQNTMKVQQAMRQQGFTPDVYLQDSTIYDQKYVEQAGDLAEGAYAYSNIALFSDTGNKEMALYRAWLEQINPGADPNFYGLYAWSAARLFLEEATRLGGDLNRASMVKALSKVKDWTSNGLHSPQDVGGKTTGKCQKIIRYTGGSWKQVSKGDYLCDTLVTTGVGA